MCWGGRCLQEEGWGKALEPLMSGWLVAKGLTNVLLKTRAV